MLRGVMSSHLGSLAAAAPECRMLACPKNRFEVLSCRSSVTQCNLSPMWLLLLVKMFFTDAERSRSAHPRATCMVNTVLVSKICLTIRCLALPSLISTVESTRLDARHTCSGSAMTARAEPTKARWMRCVRLLASAETALSWPSSASRIIRGSTMQRSATRAVASSSMTQTLKSLYFCTDTDCALIRVSMSSVTRPRPPKRPACVCGRPQITMWSVSGAWSERSRTTASRVREDMELLHLGRGPH
mmetsp:Transcript_12758/g.32167  ORF Transcript_12758/g.32167 Transcript_12758/m.32167 type:complete len:245 (-) Transcript_12758:2378-3112(-)